MCMLNLCVYMVCAVCACCVYCVACLFLCAFMVFFRHKRYVCERKYVCILSNAVSLSTRLSGKLQLKTSGGNIIEWAWTVQIWFITCSIDIIVGFTSVTYYCNSFS